MELPFSVNDPSNYGRTFLDLRKSKESNTVNKILIMVLARVQRFNCLLGQNFIWIQTWQICLM